MEIFLKLKLVRASSYILDNYEDVTNQAWARAQQLGLKPDASGTLKVPMDKIVGRSRGQAADMGQLFYNVKIKMEASFCFSGNLNY
ncbi:MAG: hypothetical protein CSB33_00130 [Desulfobacterales bacterium]|nr:MAG: hypothetical protein CSB33_00130 [Desulfobacterales bacterium]